MGLWRLPGCKVDLIYDDDERLIRWASLRIGGGIQFRSDAKAIGGARDGEIVAVTVFDGFSVCDCNIHIATDLSRQWASRGYLAASFAFPFVQCGFSRVTGLVPSKNIPALTFDMKLGFTLEGRIRHGMPDDDIIILGMLREECRWIPQDTKGACHG